MSVNIISIREEYFKLNNWFGLVWFYGISTIDMVYQLLPNPFFLHINSSISNHSV